MPNFIKIKDITSSSLEKMGYSWHSDKDGKYIVTDKLLIVSQKEARNYSHAAEELYKMYETATEYVIQNNLFSDLDIPSHLVQTIKYSWLHERNNHLYGRFDFSGGIDNKPIKLIEFNADTPTLLLETAIIQWLLLENSDITQKKQFNSLYEAIGKKIKSITAPYKAEFSRILFSCVKNIDEEFQTTKLLQQIAKDSGLSCNFSYLEDIHIGAQYIYDSQENTYEIFFKLYPWEEMHQHQASLHTKIINPAFTLLYQSKAMLVILYTLFPDSPYLLETSFFPLKNKKYVKKRAFGREGANIEIVTKEGKILQSTQGEYAHHKAIYQEYTEFIRDKEKNYYQAGLFYSDGAAGLGFRRGGEILDDMSQFVGHLII